MEIIIKMANTNERNYFTEIEALETILEFYK